MPPPDLADRTRYPEGFDPAPDFLRWIRDAFLDEGSTLYNYDHDHLAEARIGVLWTNVLHTKNMRQVAATAEMPQVTGGKWVRARMDFQLREWFGEEPEFLLTFDAVLAAQITAAQFCARVDHELYHCGQLRDAFGLPRFRRSDGRPLYGIRGHDAEEFVGVVERYGVGAASDGVARLVQAAQRPPTVAAVDLEYACGTCGAAI